MGVSEHGGFSVSSWDIGALFRGILRTSEAFCVAVINGLFDSV